jgi:hypothetical protein
MQLWDALAPSFAIEDLDRRIEARKQLLQPGGNVYTRLEVIDDLLSMSSTPYYLSDTIGLADACVFNVASQLATGCGFHSCCASDVVYLRTAVLQRRSVAVISLCLTLTGGTSGSGCRFLDGLENDAWHATIREFKHIQSLRDKVALDPKLVDHYSARADTYKAFLPHDQ